MDERRVAVVAGVFFFLPYFAFMLVAADPMAGMSAAASKDTGAMLERLTAFYGQVWWVIIVMKQEPTKNAVEIQT